MKRGTRRIMLGLVASLSAVCLAIGLLNRDLFRDATVPHDPEEAAEWLAEHPADALAASVIAAGALDTSTPHRLELWRSAYAHAKRLAPYRPNADTAFVQAGMFHWTELGAADRARVLEVTESLMREPLFFGRMLEPLWQLTRDFAWLHANAPDTIDARGWLRDLAVRRGLFAEYHVLREDIRSRRMSLYVAQRGNADPAQLLRLLPQHLTVADEPLVQGILEELERKPFDREQLGNQADWLVDYAIRHDIRPLTGITPLLETPSPLRDVTRARAALDLNDPDAASSIEVTSVAADNQEWTSYFLDRAIFEARRGDSRAADAYLLRAAAGEAAMSIAVRATAERVATILGDAKAAADYRRQLDERAKEPRKWTGGCGANELCAVATRDEYIADGMLRLDLTTTQSDEIPPYVEIYIDDALRAEGAVEDARAFEIPVQPGLHRVELRLINTHTRNGTQRRVRIGP